MIWAAVIVIVLILSAVVSVYVAIHKHVAYYLPPVSVGKLSREVHQHTAMAASLRQDLETSLIAFKIMLNDLNQVHQVTMASHDAMLKVVTTKAVDIVAHYEQGLFDDIIRDVRFKLATDLEQGLIDRTTRLAGEYVLLQSLDELDLEVSLSARSFRPEDVREAILRLLRYEFPKRSVPKTNADYAKWFREVSDNGSRFKDFMGELGEELFTMQWEGKVALSLAKAPASAGLKVVPNTPLAVSN